MAGVERLRRRAEFLRVAATRQKWAAPGLVLQAAASPGDHPNKVRVGFTATRKIGIAVLRNRARRRLRAAVAAILPLHAAPGHDYVVVARAGTLTRPFPALVGDLEAALRRLGAWRDAPVAEAADAGEKRMDEPMDDGRPQ